MSANPDTAAPTGRKKPAQGKERSEAALGHASQNTSSPGGAKEGGEWPVVKSGDLLSFVTSGSRGWARYYSESGPLFLRVGNLDHDSVSLDLRDIQRVAPPVGAEGTRTKVQPSDILISVTADVGMVGLVPPTLGEAYINQHVALARPLPTVHPPFLAWCLTSPPVQRQFRQLQRGATKVGLGLDDIRAVDVPLPPLPEQRRIVGEIEKQFTRLEAGVAALRRVQANLKRYRAAVLKAACEGRLVPTEAELTTKNAKSTKTKPASLSAFSAAKTPGYETGAELLSRILTERRQNWQGRGKYKEPDAPDTANLPTLPESWTWVSWEMVLAHEEGAFKRGPFGSALTKAIFVEKGFKVYEQYCPINDDCSFARYYITPEKFEELQAFEVKAGDYLISCSGVTLGRITRVPEQFERGIINQALLRVRINESVIDHRYFLHLFRSALFQKAIFDNSIGSAIPNVKGVKELKAMAIPLPPLAEQTRIVAEVERRLSVVEELESVVSANLQRATRLRQSILQKAFTGELVPGA